MNAHYTWKEGHITPLHNKGSKGEPENYIPVSLTSLLAKCMEAFISEAVLEHMMTYNSFSDDQHGFVAGRSCMTQLLTVLRGWTNGLALGVIIDVISFPKHLILCHMCVSLVSLKNTVSKGTFWCVYSYLSRVDVRELVWKDLFLIGPALQVEYHKVQCLDRCYLSYS